MKDFNTVLIIEDNHDMRVVLRQHLEELGFSVVSAANGRDALLMLECGMMPRFIISDLKMPIMDGAEFLQVKNSDHRFREIPTVVISGFEPERPLLDAHFISKPIDWNSLSELVSA